MIKSQNCPKMTVQSMQFPNITNNIFNVIFTSNKQMLKVAAKSEQLDTTCDTLIKTRSFAPFEKGQTMLRMFHFLTFLKNIFSCFFFLWLYFST